MNTDFDFEAHNPRLRYIVREYQKEAVKAQYRRRDAANIGLWSMSPLPALKARTMSQIVTDAEIAWQRAEAFAASPRGRFVKAVAQLVGFQEAASARAAYDRGFAGETINVREVGFAITCLINVSNYLLNVDEEVAIFEGIEALAEILQAGA